MNDPLTVIPSDALSALRQMADESVQCVVTSPPYWSLRDYGIEPIVWDGDPECEHEWGEPQVGRVSGGGDRPPDNKWKGVERTADKAEARYTCVLCGAWKGCLGLEPTPELYVQHIVQIFREVKRVLRKDGTLWLNIGDSYFGDSPTRKTASEAFSKTWDPANTASNGGLRRSAAQINGFKPKSLCMIPARLAISLQHAGWFVRSEIAWCKRAPMPESVTDRPTSSTEKIFLLTKSRQYFYNNEAVRERYSEATFLRLNQRTFDTQTGGDKDPHSGNRSARKSLENLKARVDKQRGHSRRHAGFNDRWDAMTKEEQGANGANLRNYWVLGPETFPDAHFAVFPTEIPRRCILLGSKTGDVILDPFAGSGTTGKVAIELGRQAILIEPKAEYIEMIKRRCQTTIGLPL